MAKKIVKKKSPIKAKIEVDCDDISSSNCRKPRGGCFYGLGFLGSAIYFISTAGSFWAGALGVLKSLVWPVFMILELFKFLKV